MIVIRVFHRRALPWAVMCDPVGFIPKTGLKWGPGSGPGPTPGADIAILNPLAVGDLTAELPHLGGPQGRLSGIFRRGGCPVRLEVSRSHPAGAPPIGEDDPPAHGDLFAGQWRFAPTGHRNGECIHRLWNMRPRLH